MRGAPWLPAHARPRRKIEKSFLVLFFKKELLACLLYKTASKRFFLKKEAKTFFL